MAQSGMTGTQEIRVAAAQPRQVPMDGCYLGQLSGAPCYEMAS